MLKRSALLAAMLLLVFSAASPAGGKRTRTVDATLKQGLVHQDSRGNHYAGRITGRPGGTGATLLVASPGSTPGTIDVRGTAFYRRGTIRLRGTNTATAQPDGSFTFQGSGTITGGTGRFKGARGSVTFSGTQPANDPVQTFEIDGTIRY